MSRVRLNRMACNHWRTFATWAMIPLAVFNSRTVLGCGCSGHFESSCQCNCFNSRGGSHIDQCVRCAHGDSLTCPCCSKVEKSAPVENIRASDCGTAVHGPHCRVMAVHEVIPATVVIANAAVDLNPSALVLDSIDLPVMITQSGGGHVRFLNLGPPPSDLVVTLRRFVI